MIRLEFSLEAEQDLESVGDYIAKDNPRRAAAKAEFRTLQGQLEFWALVGRAALDNPDLPASFIAESLMSMAEPREDSSEFIPRFASRA